MMITRTHFKKYKIKDKAFTLDLLELSLDLLELSESDGLHSESGSLHAPFVDF